MREREETAGTDEVVRVRRTLVGLMFVLAIVMVVLIVQMGGGKADASESSESSGAAAPRLSVQKIGPGRIAETSYGVTTVTFRVKFDCGTAPVGTFLQVETFVVQGGAESPNVAFGATGARCARGPQTVVATAYADPFYPDIRFVRGRAQARATVYGCPDGSEEFCGNFIDELSRTIRLV